VIRLWPPPLLQRRSRRWGRVGVPPRRAAPWRREDGSASIEFVIVVPAVIAVMFLAIQVALYSYARSIALTAAQEAANAERSYGAAPGAGRDKATDFLGRAGDGLSTPGIDVQRDAQEVRVTITGRCLSVIPGFDGFTVRQSASGPVERFT
jgi:Flp pilus assembly protein TadG